MTEKNKCKCGLLSCEAVNAKDGDNRFVLKALPYGEDALEPHISGRTLAYHYGKHLAGRRGFTFTTTGAQGQFAKIDQKTLYGGGQDLGYVAGCFHRHTKERITAI